MMWTWGKWKDMGAKEEREDKAEKSREESTKEKAEEQSREEKGKKRLEEKSNMDRRRAGEQRQEGHRGDTVREPRREARAN